MKRIIILVAALVSLGAPQSSAMAQTAPQDAVMITAAQPAIDALLRSLPQGTALSPTQVLVDTLGQAHVRLAQSYKGVPVFEGDAIVHLDVATGRVLGTTNATLSFAPIGITPSVSETRAAEASRAHFAHPHGLAGKRNVAILVKDGVASLNWKVQSDDDAPAGRVDTVAFVDAQRGTVTRAWNNLQTAAVAGTAAGMYMNQGGATITLDKTTSYALRNPTAPTFYTCDLKNKTSTCSLFTSTTASFGNGLISATGATAGADAQFGAEKTLGYYKTKFGRNGIDNKGMATYSRVHYGRSYENAFWTDSCKCMTYGDGASTFYPLVSIDVAGHEMSHGVTSSSAKLTYSGESGGLNEATSDIFGTMVEYYANGGFDAPDYMIGEMIWKSNWSGSTNRGAFAASKALRYMYNPGLDGASKNCWYSGVGSLDVHYSSGIANHFFYLLAEGSNGAGMPVSPTCNSATVTGLGRDKAEQVWYRALTVYMTASTTYAGARQATISAATDLGYDVEAVKSAWAAVNVN